MKTSIRNTWTLLLAGLLLAQFALVNAKAADTTPPTLVFSSPVNGANNVPLDSKVIFTFSEAMQVPSDYSQAIFWSDAGQLLVPANFNYSWSADAKTLTCAYSGPLPAADMISWFLLGFLDLADNPLAITFPLPAGNFVTTGGGGGGTNDCSGTASTGNFTTYNLFKMASYVQNSAAVSAPDTSTDPFSFSASVNLATNRTATAVTLTVPGGALQPMSSFFAGSYLLVDSTNDLAKLDALYPSGNYTFTVTGSPNQTVPANLPGNALPNAPHVSNYAAAQTINAGAAFTLVWDAFVGGRVIDSIGVEVYSSSHVLVFQITNSAGCPSVLPGTATSVVLPANTLVSNQTYTTHIRFLKNISNDTNSFPGSVVFVGGQSTTEVTIATGTGGLVSPRLEIRAEGNGLVLAWPATATGYVVDWTTNLSDANSWGPYPGQVVTANQESKVSVQLGTQSFFRLRK